DHASGSVSPRHATPWQSLVPCGVGSFVYARGPWLCPRLQVTLRASPNQVLLATGTFVERAVTRYKQFPGVLGLPETANSAAHHNSCLQLPRRTAQTLL